MTKTVATERKIPTIHMAKNGEKTDNQKFGAGLLTHEKPLRKQ